MTDLLVVGAHLDDAVLTCGRVLAVARAAVVCTVFAGRPDPALGHATAGSTAWDAACGFMPGDDVVGVRTAEDDVAMQALEVSVVRLPFVDAQYAPRPPTADVAEALDDVLRALRPRQVLVPLGLLHRDHRSVAAAWVRLLRSGRPGRWSLAEDAPYRDFVPVRTRLAALARCGLVVGAPVATTDADVGPAAARRRAAALAAYSSQGGALSGLAARGDQTGHLEADVVRSVVALPPGT